MNYNLLICVANKLWTAIDINTDGKCDRISFDGNDTLEINASENVTEFCRHILNYYNIDDFCDIELSIKIVMVSEYSELIEILFFQLKGAKSINVIDSKSIMPICVLKNCIVKPGGVIDIKCMEEKFTLQVDDALVASYVSDKAGKEIIVEPEDFSILFRFDCKNLISDETEFKALEEKFKKDAEKKQRKIDEHKKRYSELKKKYDELEKKYIQLKNEVEDSKLTFDDKRTILRFSIDMLKGEKTESIQGAMVVSRVLAAAISGSSLLNENKKYICKLLKTDGEVVKKGIPLMEIDEIYSINGDVARETGRKSVIKANKNGRIFYLVNNNDSVRDNEAVVLVSDPADDRTGIMKWYNKMK